MERKNTAIPETSESWQFNPIKIKLESLSECFEQLRNGLPHTQEEYVEAEKITHSYVKSCLLMIIQRATEINRVIIEFRGQTPPHQKYHTFLVLHQNNVIDKQTLVFFMNALNCYENIIDPYKEADQAELYSVASELLIQGEAYAHQLEKLFRDTTPSPRA